MLLTALPHKHRAIVDNDADDYSEVARHAVPPRKSRADCAKTTAHNAISVDDVIVWFGNSRYVAPLRRTGCLAPGVWRKLGVSDALRRTLRIKR